MPCGGLYDDPHTTGQVKGSGESSEMKLESTRAMDDDWSGCRNTWMTKISTAVMIFMWVYSASVLYLGFVMLSAGVGDPTCSYAMEKLYRSCAIESFAPLYEWGTEGKYGIGQHSSIYSDFLKCNPDRLKLQQMSSSTTLTRQTGNMLKQACARMPC